MLSSLCLLLALSVQGQEPIAKVSSQTIPLATNSVESRQALERGVVKWENHRMGEAVEEFRKSVQADPGFATAHLFLSTLTPNPEEQSSELKQALALRDVKGPDEQLLIDWLANTSQNQILPAIAAMNELLDRYPKDKHLLYRAAIWFRNQRQIDRSIKLYEQLLQIDPKFADALNQLGYIYAFQGQFDKALATMKRYVAALPHEPNPEDSYAEIFRMAGRYKEALTHYSRALQIEPSFWSSQEAIAATYSLMGDQAKAREEFAKAIQHAPSQATALNWTMNSAVTWIREKKYVEATEEFRSVARKAHENNLAEAEATAYRMMSLYETDPAARQQLLDQGEAALHHNHSLTKLAREQQAALIQRTRIYADLDAGNLKAANRTLDQLRSVSEETHNGFIQVVAHGATGAVLATQGKYEDAVSELLEDDRNPYSLKFLIMAYQKNGAAQEAARWSARLNAVKNPTLELALVTAAPVRTVAAASTQANSQK